MHHGVRGWPERTRRQRPVFTDDTRTVWSPCVEPIKLLRQSSACAAVKPTESYFKSAVRSLYCIILILFTFPLLLQKVTGGNFTSCVIIFSKKPDFVAIVFYI